MANKIFISYSSDDRELRQIFENRLQPYLKSTNNKFDDSWDDVEMPFGENWKQKIQIVWAESQGKLQELL